MSARPRLLMCPPVHFGVDYVINPWMEGNVGRTDARRARTQWDGLLQVLRRHADVELIDPVPNLPDMCFVANAGVVCNGAVVLSLFRYAERDGERPHARRWFVEHDKRVLELSGSAFFEGEGDALFQPDEPVLWCGYGVRSSLHVYRRIAEWLGVEVKPLRLIDERFYHLDTCFAPLPGRRAVYYPAAFDHESLETLRAHFPPDSRIEVSAEDALGFACNAVVLDDTFVTAQASPALQKRLHDWGYETVVCPLDEFMRAGGAAKCLVLRLDNRIEARRGQAPSTIAERVVVLRGQLLDTDLLNTALDAITDLGGSFEFENFRPGLRHDEASAARIRVTAPSDERMDEVLAALLKFGAVLEEQPREVVTAVVEQDGVAPRNFYSTTIYPTDVLLRGHWVRVERQRMDAVIVVDDARGHTAACVLIGNLKQGDRVVCGAEGVRVSAPADSGRSESFSFMGGGVSSERRVEVAIERVAWEMQRIRERGGKIVVVAGPVVVHTGGAPYLAQLIDRGYVQALLGGNAIAVHDMEYNVLGTSLGVDLRRGQGVPGGHRHHLHVINEVRRAGSIRAAVEQGFITGGIMHACVRRDVPFCLAGSIRDDGPLPETVMDLFEAQRRYAELAAGADLILILSSMLHAIATGNMTPAGVRLICVDINPAVVTKLADRGSLESVGVVTDVGLFLNLLLRRLKELDAKT